MALLLPCLLLLAAIVVVALVIAWHPKAKPPPVLDCCEVCGKPATHELGGTPRVQAEAGGRSAMIATYCKADAPDGAVRVR